MKTNRISLYAKWLVSGTSYLYIKDFLDKEEKNKTLIKESKKENPGNTKM